MHLNKKCKRERHEKSQTDYRNLLRCRGNEASYRQESAQNDVETFLFFFLFKNEVFR